eukprot:3937851-Rhodomonas_salina.6
MQLPRGICSSVFDPRVGCSRHTRLPSTSFLAAQTLTLRPRSEVRPDIITALSNARGRTTTWVQRLSESMPLCVCACCSSSASPQRERPILEHDTHCLNMQARHDFDGEPPLGLDFGRTLIAVTLSLTIMLFCSQSTPSLSHLQAPVGLNFLFDNPGWETR